MSTTVQNLIQNSIGDGARSTKWDVAFNFTDPSIFPSAENVAVMCKACTLPARGLSTIEFKLKGRTIPIRGQVKYSGTFDCTFYSDERMKLRHAFETWIAACDEMYQYGELYADLESNIQAHARNGYTKDISLYQINFEESEQTAKYTIYNVFPTEIGAITLDSESPEIETFTVTFAFSNFDLDTIKGSSGNFIGGFMSQLKGASASMISKLTGMLSSEVDKFLRNSGINAMADAISEFPGKALKSVTDSFTDSFSEALRNGLTFEGESFSSGFTSAITNITTGINEVMSIGTQALGAVTDIASQAASAVGSLAGQVAGAVGSLLKDTASSILGSVKSGVSSLADNLGITDALAKMKSKSTNMKDPVMAKIYQAKGGVEGAMSKASSLIGDAKSAASSAISGALSSAKGAVGSMLS